MSIQMTDTARRQGWKETLIIVPSYLITVWMLHKLLVLVYGVGDIEANRIAFSSVWGIFLFFSLAQWIYGEAVGGKVLLDCGPHSSKSIFLVLGIVLGLICFLFPTSLSEWLSFNGPWFELSMAVFFIVFAFGRLRMRENGIMQCGRLLRWSRIASYRWADDATLLVSKRNRFSLQAALPVPPEQKEAVDELLTRFCPVPETT